jgi:septum site-determining protein MinD
MLKEVPSRLIINKFSRKQLNKELSDLDAVIDAVGARLISVIPDDPALASACTADPATGSSPAVLEIEDLARQAARSKGEA